MSYRYDAFGNLFNNMAAPYNATGYTGKTYDTKAGLMDYNARWYSPPNGRFISEDTFTGWKCQPQSLNRYSYAQNNPVNFTDPTGHCIPVGIDSDECIIVPPGGSGDDDTGSGGGDTGGSGGSGDTNPGGEIQPPPPPPPTPEEIRAMKEALLIELGGPTPPLPWYLRNVQPKPYSLAYEYPYSNGDPLKLVKGIYNFLIGDDIAELTDGDLSWGDALAATTFLPGIGVLGKLGKTEKVIVKAVHIGEDAAKIGRYANVGENYIIDDVYKAAEESRNLAKGAGEAAKGWKVGDDINTLTKAGKYPSWSTAKSRYWKNETAANPSKYSQENLDRMVKGKAPLDEDFGVPKELHHINGRSGSDPHNINNLQEVWPWEHTEIDPYRYYNGPQP
ncbi:RHS repeat-associated core domain-containing protein [Tepidibacillus marianensis]|uniref:RHS repeat-associated core domain-containing protein n=1 Tax=Tepidibacillus marianensis TaxID=3131995 RepID=UPI0030CDE0C8